MATPTELRRQHKKYAKKHKQQVHIPPLERHANHQVEIRPGVRHNAAQYWCMSCDKWVAWLSKDHTRKAKELGLIE